MVQNQFEFYWGIGRLKQLLRQGWINNIPISAIESIADHSFGVGLLSYVLALWENTLRGESGNLNLHLSPSELCVAGLFHDVAEAYYIDIDKITLDLLPELKSLKIKAERRGFEKIFGYWMKKNTFIKKNVENKYSENLDDESNKFIDLVDKLELHWQTITYFKQGWLSKTNSETFITSTYNSIAERREMFKIINYLMKEGLLIQDISSLDK